MIIAILPKENRTFAGVVQYNAPKSECLKYFNTFSNNDTTFQKELQFDANLNNRVKDPVFHAVLSLTPGEEIDRELILDMIEEFMDKRVMEYSPSLSTNTSTKATSIFISSRRE